MITLSVAAEAARGLLKRQEAASVPLRAAGKLHWRPACRFWAAMRSSRRRGRRKGGRQSPNGRTRNVQSGGEADRRRIVCAVGAASGSSQDILLDLAWEPGRSGLDLFPLRRGDLGQGHGSDRQDIVP